MNGRLYYVHGCKAQSLICKFFANSSIVSTQSWLKY